MGTSVQLQVGRGHCISHCGLEGLRKPRGGKKSPTTGSPCSFSTFDGLIKFRYFVRYFFCVCTLIPVFPTLCLPRGRI
jgi:hypothetical protein